MIDELFIYARILFSRILSRWMHSSPIITLTGFMIGVLIDMRVYLLSIFVLVIIDMISGIAASLHRGERFSSRKLRTGLIDRIILYGTLFVITLMIDTMLKGTIDYGRDYVAIVCCMIIGFYEAGSCIENLVSRFPKYTFLKKIGGMLNLLEKSYEDSTIQKITDVMKASDLLTKREHKHEN